MESLASPELKILVQPIKKLRFRYESERIGTHGRPSNIARKKHQQVPTVELVNFHGDKAIIRCTLVSVNEDCRVPHAHRLFFTRKDNCDDDSPYELEVSENNHWKVSFIGIGIDQTGKKSIKEEIIRKMRLEFLEKLREKNRNIKSLSEREETEIKMNAEKAQKWMNLNSVALCFRGYARNNEGILDAITEPVYSDPINNSKSALTGKLKICRISKQSGSCAGNDEMIFLVEKVNKENIEVKFFEMDEEGNQIWCSYKKSTELDVHYQYAIVLQTPPYRNLEITSPRDIWIQLERPADGHCSEHSEPIKFTYNPTDNPDMPRKRPRSSNSESENTIPSNTLGTISNDELIPEDFSADIDEYIRNNYSEECLRYEDLMTDCKSQLCVDSKSSNLRSLLNGYTFAPQFLIRTTHKFKRNSINKKKLCSNTPSHSALHYDKKGYFFKIITSPHLFSKFFNSKIKKGQMSLQFTVISDHSGWQCVNIFIKTMTEIEREDDIGKNLLQCADKTESIQTIDSLLKIKADLNNYEETCDATALNAAIEGGETEIIRCSLGAFFHLEE